MKYWELSKWDNVIVFAECLKPDASLDRVLNVGICGDSVTFTEGCDNYFSATFSKADAVEALRELANHIAAS